MKRLVLAALVLLASSFVATADPLRDVPVLAYTVEQRAPHDRRLFTQGMVFDGDTLIESGGGYRASRLLRRATDSSTALQTRNLPAEWFAEGIAVHQEQLWLLTWREGIVQRFSLPGLHPGTRLRYRGEGWGLTSDGESLVHSDGSATLRWRDATDFRVLRELEVHAGKQVVSRLNELEWVEGWVLANVWQTDWVIGIDPGSGEVRFKLDVAPLLTPGERRAAEVANGIAWHAPTRRLWVSGKRWPAMFALRLEFPAIAPTPPAP